MFIAGTLFRVSGLAIQKLTGKLSCRTTFPLINAIALLYRKPIYDEGVKKIN